MIKHYNFGMDQRRIILVQIQLIIVLIIIILWYMYRNSDRSAPIEGLA